MCFDDSIKIADRNSNITKMSLLDNANMNYFKHVSRKHRAAMFANFSPQFPYFCVNFVSLLVEIEFAWQEKFLLHTQFSTAESLICILQAFFVCAKCTFSAVVFFSFQSSRSNIYDDDDQAKKKFFQIGLMHKETDYCSKCVFMCNKFQIEIEIFV
jgi:hypothetical protein